MGSESKEIRERWFANRYVWLLAAILLLLLGYPHFRDNPAGAFLGGLTSLVLLVAGVYAVRAHRVVFSVASALALASAVASVAAYLRGRRGDPVVEASFTLFYAFTTVVIFIEVVRTRRVVSGTLYGIVCVYLLLGITFGTLYDFVETISPGSFAYTVEIPGEDAIGWRQLIYFSFMTLTTIGYGDIRPATSEAQSLAIVEGVVGVLYVAVLIARIVGIYRRDSRES